MSEVGAGGATALPLGPLNDLPEAQAQQVEVQGHLLAVVRLGDAVYVIGDTCSHERVSLSEGDIDAAACTIECPKHGAEFSLRTGEPRTLPARRPVPTYETRIEGGEVFVVLGG